MIRDLANGFLDLLYPPRCAVCRQFKPEPFCQDCHKLIEFIQAPFCPRCGVPGEARICSDCLPDDRAFKYARSVGTYESALGRAFLAFKYKPALSLAEPLGQYLCDYLDTDLGQDIREVDLVMPVPIHKRRLRERGFNQSRLLAEQVAQHLGVPLSEELLLRTKNTLPQRNLSSKERFLNVQDAFSVGNSSQLQGKRILLIDDIFTTGATVTACSKTLLHYGAASVNVLTLTRQI